MPRATKRRKVGCDCGEHETQQECNEAFEEKVEETQEDEEPAQNVEVILHRDIASSAIITSSETVGVYAGEQPQQVFLVHFDLLVLHTGIHPPHNPNPYTLLPQVTAAQFAHFVSWIYTGDIHKEIECNVEDLWVAGKALQSPRFQNHCIDMLRVVAKDQYEGADEKPYPDCDEAAMVYKNSAKDSKLRRFVADCLACCSPYSDVDAAQNAKWDAMFRANDDLGLDVLKAGKTKWGEVKPWDSLSREKYVEDVKPLDEEWKRVILSKTTQGTVMEKAKNGDVKAVVEKAGLGEKDNGDVKEVVEKAGLSEKDDDDKSMLLGTGTASLPLLVGKTRKPKWYG